MSCLSASSLQLADKVVVSLLISPPLWRKMWSHPVNENIILKKHKRKAACQYIQLLHRSGSRLFNDWSVLAAEITAVDVNA